MRLSGRQLAIMRILWDRSEATVAEIQANLDVERPLAYSTVATVLTRMEQKGLVDHRSEDRVYFYRPLVTQDGAGQTMVGELVERVFGGRPSELVNHLLDSEQVDARELRRIKQLLDAYESRQRELGGEQS